MLYCDVESENIGHLSRLSVNEQVEMLPRVEQFIHVQ